MRYLGSLICVLALSVAFVACGGEEVGCAEPVDVAGEWEMTSTVVSDNCDGRVDQTYQMTITQEGNTLTAETPELTFSGMICGNQIQMNGSFPEDEGTVTVNATLNVSAEGDSMQGSDTWTWTDGVESCSGSDSLSGTRGDGVLVTVTGTVYAAVAEDIQGPTVANATVSVGSSSTSSDANGNLSLMVPTGTQLFLSQAADSWGELSAEDVPAGGISGLELEVIPDALLGEIAGDVGVVPDTSKGMVAVVFDETSFITVGGETASISANSELSFVFDAAGDPVESDALVVDGGSEVIFLNVDLASTVTANAVTTTQQQCPQLFPGVSYQCWRRWLPISTSCVPCSNGDEMRGTMCDVGAFEVEP